MTKLKSGVLINEILMNMKKKANASEMFERRINVYSAHDTTIANLWRGFNVIEKLEFPSYGAALMIELHEIDDKYQVKILYKKSHLDDDLIELKIEGCKDNQGKETDAMCDLHIFLSALQPVVIENFDEACEVPNEQI
ncbi:prostatic acid phosphatase-like [Bemisia tabaci]|uniref:prostatic acid phosphatase-like n=1 Tax=Bemisia tabaci TaxID=7038 RepID=UPI003B27CF0F